MVEDPITENERLRRQVANLQAERLRLGHEEILREVAERQRVEREVAERDEAERAAAAAAELEDHRRAAWLAHLTDEALAGGNNSFVWFLRQKNLLADMPADPMRWPPGHPGPAAYHIAGVPAPSGKSLAGTLVGDALRKKGIKI